MTPQQTFTNRYPILFSVADKPDRTTITHDDLELALFRISEAANGSPIYRTELDTCRDHLSRAAEQAWSLHTENERKSLIHNPGHPRSDERSHATKMLVATLHDATMLPAKLATARAKKYRHPFFQKAEQYSREITPLAVAVSRLKSAALSGRRPTERLKERPENLNKVTGICPCCFGTYAVRHGTIVKHGFQRPGTGNTLGSCFGEKEIPFNRSPTGTIIYRWHLREKRDRTEETLRRMKNWKTLRVPVGKKTAGQKTEIIDRTDPRWEREFAKKKAEYDSLVRQYTLDIRVLGRKIRSWKEIPLTRPNGSLMPDDFEG